MSSNPAPPTGIPSVIRAAYVVTLASGGDAQPVPVQQVTAGTAGAFWPTTPAEPRLWPEDAGVGIRLAILDAPAVASGIPVTIGASASLVSPLSATVSAQPAPGLLLGTPLWDALNRAAYIVLGSGSNVDGALYIVDVNVGVGGASPSVVEVSLEIPCRSE